MRFSSRYAAALILPLLALAPLTPVCADVFQYMDERGVVHFTDAPTHKGFQLIIKSKEEPKPSAPEPDLQPAKPEEGPVQSAEVSPLEAMVAEVSSRYNLDPSLVLAVIEVESNFNPQAISPKGALGLMQLMPGTIIALGVANPFSPWDNIEGGVRYLAELLNFFRGNLRLALAAYNAGKEAVLKYGDIPPFKETINYVRAVMDRLGRYQAWAKMKEGKN